MTTMGASGKAKQMMHGLPRQGRTGAFAFPPRVSLPFPPTQATPVQAQARVKPEPSQPPPLKGTSAPRRPAAFKPPRRVQVEAKAVSAAASTAAAVPAKAVDAAAKAAAAPSKAVVAAAKAETGLATTAAAVAVSARTSFSKAAREPPPPPPPATASAPAATALEAMMDARRRRPSSVCAPEGARQGAASPADSVASSQASEASVSSRASARSLSRSKRSKKAKVLPGQTSLKVSCNVGPDRRRGLLLFFETWPSIGARARVPHLCRCLRRQGSHFLPFSPLKQNFFAKAPPK